MSDQNNVGGIYDIPPIHAKGIWHDKENKDRLRELITYMHSSFWWINSNSLSFRQYGNPGIYHFPVARGQQS